MLNIHIMNQEIDRLKNILILEVLFKMEQYVMKQIMLYSI